MIAQWVAHLLNELQQWPYYKMFCISLEWFCCEKGVLNQIMQLVEFWHALLNQNSNDIHPQSLWKHKVPQTPSSVKLMISLVYGIQGVFACHPISQGQIVNTQFYSHFSSTICVVQLEVSRTCWKWVHSCTGGWDVLQCQPYSDLSPCDWSDSKTEITITWQMICKQNEYLTGSLALGGKHWYNGDGVSYLLQQ